MLSYLLGVYNSHHHSGNQVLEDKADQGVDQPTVWRIPALLRELAFQLRFNEVVSFTS